MGNRSCVGRRRRRARWKELIHRFSCPVAASENKAARLFILWRSFFVGIFLARKPIFESLCLTFGKFYKMMRSRFLLLLLATLMLACNPNQKSVEPVEFVILQMNDVYEIAPLDGGKVGGIARVATIRKELLKANPHVITVLSGDFLSPSLIGTLKEAEQRISGAQMVESLNALGLDYVTFGNHEFDLKEADLLRQLDASQFQYTIANVLHQVDGQTVPFAQNGAAVPEHIIHEFKQGDEVVFRLGLIGVLLPFNKKKYVAYEDVNQSFLETHAAIKEQCDAVIGITHLEMNQDRELAGSLTDVPLLLGGHDHEHMIDSVGSVRITKADANAKTVYIHYVTYDPKTGKTKVRSELRAVDESVALDPEVDAIVQKWVKRSNEIMVDMGYQPDEVLFMATDPLEGREVYIRSEQTNLGSLIGDAMLQFVPSAEAVLLNSGSIRLDDVLDGPVKQVDVLRTLPFGGKVGIAEFTGSELIETLEIGTVKNKGVGGYLQLRNIVKEEGQWLVNGTAINPEKAYSIASMDFLMSGGEANLDFLGKITTVFPEVGGQDQDVRNDIRDIVIDYGRDLGAEIEAGTEAVEAL